MESTSFRPERSGAEKSASSKVDFSVRALGRLVEMTVPRHFDPERSGAEKSNLCKTDFSALLHFARKDVNILPFRHLQIAFTIPGSASGQG